MDIVRVDPTATDELFGAQAIQLPEGVGELIPNLLFIGPHTQCDEMVRRFGVRYVIDVFEDKEVVSTAKENGYAERCDALSAELAGLRRRATALLVEEEERLCPPLSTDDNALPTVVEDTLDAEPSATVADAHDVNSNSEHDDDDDAAVALPPIIVEDNAPLQGLDGSSDGISASQSIAIALQAKQRFLQLVADIQTTKIKVETLTAKKVLAEAEAAAALVAKEATVADGALPNAQSIGSSALPNGKKVNDYQRFQDCNVVSPVTATSGYEVCYPPAVQIVHIHTRDALVEDITRVLNLGKSKPLPPTATKGPSDEVEGEAEGSSSQGSSSGSNGFVTMEELLLKYPPPAYDPPYALVEYLDSILTQNPSEMELTNISLAAMRKHKADRLNKNRDDTAVPHSEPFDCKPAITRHAVYIHCFAGKSRSASIAAAYSMLSSVAGHKPLDEVMDLLSYMTPITVKRPQGYVVRRGQGCRPNPRFMRDLMALEAGVQTALQSRSKVPPSRCRPFETAFDIDQFNVDGLLELFSTTPNPNAQIPEDIVIDTYEKVCCGDVIKARRLLVAEQTRLLLSPRVRQEMICDNIMRVLEQDIDYYMLERQKAYAGVQQLNNAVEGHHNNPNETPEERRRRIDSRLRSMQVAANRQLVMSTLSDCDFNEERALAKLRLLRAEKASQHMKDTS